MLSALPRARRSRSPPATLRSVLDFPYLIVAHTYIRLESAIICSLSLSDVRQPGVSSLLLTPRASWLVIARDKLDYVNARII